MTPDSSPTRLHDIKRLIEFQADKRADQVFLVDPVRQRKILYGELLGLVRAVSENVNLLGAEPGDSVAYALSNSADCAIAILGLLYGGYRATAVNLVAGAKTIAYVLEHSQSKLVISAPEHDKLLDDALGESSAGPKRVYVDQVSAPCGARTAVSGPVDISASTDGLLMYTSGTTGQPKGVLLTHANLVAGGSNAVLAHALASTDRALCVLPLYHINGLCVTIMGPLVSGGSVVLPDRFSTSRFWSQIIDNECTWFSVVPTQISYLLHDENNNAVTASKLANLRFGRSASAPLAPEVQSAFEKRFGIPVIETMGLTETAAQILSNPLPPAKRKIGSPGIAIGNEVIIADDHQNELPVGQEGEILVRGPNVMRLYFKNRKATQEALPQDGWLRTGDLGRMDEDGYFFVTGRLKELIIKGGENIAPREIDEVLYGHQDVIEAAAFAYPCTDYGQTVHAAVKLTPKSTASEKELLDFCRPRLGPVKTPERIYFLDDLPKGPSGKIQRSRIIEIV